MPSERAIIDLTVDPPSLQAVDTEGQVDFSVREGDLVQLENSVHRTDDFEVEAVVEEGIRVQAAGLGGFDLIPEEKVAVTSGMTTRDFIVSKADGGDILSPDWSDPEVRD